MRASKYVVALLAAAVGFTTGAFSMPEESAATYAPYCALTLTKTVDKANALPGDTLTYTIKVKNTGTGNCTGSGVRIKDVLSPHLSFISETHSSGITPGYDYGEAGTVPVYDSSTRTLIWNGNTITPGQTQTITLKTRVETPATCDAYQIINQAFATALELNNYGTWSASNGVVTNVASTCVPPVAAQCTVTPASLFVGGTATFTATATGGTGSYAYAWTGTDGLTGSAASVSKTYSTVGTKVGTVTVTSGSFSTTTSCSVPVTTQPSCELELIKTVDKEDAQPGDTITYALTVKNIGTADCTGGGVKVKDVVSPHLEFLSESRTNDFEPGYNGIPLYTTSTRTLMWDANILYPGESGTITWKAKVLTPTQCGSYEIENQAFTTSKEYNNFGTWVASNKVFTDVSNSCPPPLFAQCTVSPETLYVGGTATYAANASGGTGSYTYAWTGTDGLTGTASTAPKTYLTTGVKTGTVTVTSGTQSTTTSCSVTVTDRPYCDMVISKAVDRAVATSGEFLTYTLTVKNIGTGPCDASDVWVRDPVHDDLVYVSQTHSANIIPGFDASHPAYESAIRMLNWKTTTFAPNETGTITWKAAFNPDLACGTTTVNNIASVSLGDYGTLTYLSTRYSQLVSTEMTKVCPPPPLTLQCEASPTSAFVGDIVDWTSTVSGGTGVYAYSWTGTDGLSATIASTSKTYATAGVKTGTVTVVSGAQTKSATCTTTISVIPPAPAKLTVKKVVINNDGGTTTAEAFSIHVRTVAGTDIVGSPAAGSTTGRTYTLPAGSYVVGEDDSTALGYLDLGVTGDCSVDGEVTLAPGEHKTCTITNDDIGVPVFDPYCTASPNAILAGGSITWEAFASGGTGSYTYAWTGTDGLTGVGKTVAKQYPLTGTKHATVTVSSGSFSETVSCKAVVDNPPTPDPLRASCAVTVNTTSLNSPATFGASASGGTGSYTYAWEGTDGLTGDTQSVSKSYGTYGTKSARVTVTSGSQSVTSELCMLNIIPPGPCVFGCGGFEQPTVVLYKKPATSTLAAAVYLTQQPFTPRVAGVYLSQVPYTGITGTTAAILFAIAVAAWSMFVAYAMENRRFGFANLLGMGSADRYRFRATPPAPPARNGDHEDDWPFASEDVDGSVPIDAYRQDVPAVHATDDSLDSITPPPSNNAPTMATYQQQDVPANLPTDDTATINPQLRDMLFKQARERKALVSEEAGKLLITAAYGNASQAAELLDGAIKHAEEKYLKEDGWILLNRDKVSAFLKGQGVVAPAPASTPAPAPASRPVMPPPVRPIAPAPAPSPVKDVRQVIEAHVAATARAVDRQMPPPAPVASNVNGNGATATTGTAVSFLKAVSSRDTASVVAAIRSLKERNIDAGAFATDLILELDSVHRSRLENDSSLANPEIARAAANWSARDIEEVITVLFSMAEHEYQSQSVSMKLAALRLGRIGR